MKFNRILNDLIDWIRRVLHFEQRNEVAKPYSILEVSEYPKGILKRVKRPTPRAVDTYIYTPKSQPIEEGFTTVKSFPHDYHICLDHLWKLENESNGKAFLRRNFNNVNPPRKQSYFATNSNFSKYSHSITVLQASKNVDKDGNYIANVIFHKKFDFIGKDLKGYRDKYAVPTLKDFIRLAGYRNNKEFFNTVNIDNELLNSQKKYMGGYYIYKENASQTNPIIVEGVKVSG